MTTETPEATPRGNEAAAMFAEPVADAGSRRAIKLVVMTAFLVGSLTPVTTDVLLDLQLQFWYGRLQGMTVAPSPEKRMSGSFIAISEPLQKKLAQVDIKDPGDGEPRDEPPMGFLQKVIVLWKALLKWIKTPSEQGDAANALYLAGTFLVLTFAVLCRVFGVNRVMAMISGAFGPDRFKKLIIDVFFLKGVERQIFPRIKETAVKDGRVCQEPLNRVDLHDIIRVTLAVQGDGSIESLRESVTVEGRPAYTYCPSITGSGGDYYFNLAHVTTRSVKVSADILLHASGGKAQPRVRFDITGFKAAQWE